MNILYIARNIPVPGIIENDILLRIRDSIQDKSEIKIDTYFPVELLPPPLFLKGRLKRLALLPDSFYVKNTQIDKIKYLRFPWHRFAYSFVSTVIQLNKNFVSKLKKYKLIHAHTVMPDGYIGSMMKTNWNLPLIVTLRNGDLDKLNKLSKNSSLRAKYNQVLKHADKIIVHNYATEKYVKELNLDYLKIPHGIESELLNNERSSKEKIIICVSEFKKRKNIDWIVKAFKRVNPQGWSLVLVGDGREEEKLKSLANHSNIKFMGRIPRGETLKLMSKSSIFVLPSNDETFGLVYLEAAINGCAIIAKKYTGIYGWLENQKEAIFIENMLDLEKAFTTLIENDIKRKKLAESGREKVRDDMIWDDQIIKYINSYSEIINRKIGNNLNC